MVLANDLEALNAFPWGALTWNVNRDSIRSVVMNKVSGKGKGNGMHYTLSGFPHALLVWAYESILPIAQFFCCWLSAGHS
ncbi:hypothetical protein L484_010294 [Morus notabilis]|uniref:Uncharacterized protein n=1 Tax=Morus notabilis TaxID=981085 RepID=W9QY36_9ROSA|nr:hypothetical protein L484_010294 [Morus notabilis]